MHKLYELKKVKKILIATNNPGKFRELKEILPKKIRYLKPKDFNFCRHVYGRIFWEVFFGRNFLGGFFLEDCFGRIFLRGILLEELFSRN